MGFWKWYANWLRKFITLVWLREPTVEAMAGAIGGMVIGIVGLRWVCDGNVGYWWMLLSFPLGITFVAHGIYQDFGEHW